METNNFIDLAVRISLIALMAVWCFVIASPFIGPVIWGVIIAVGSYPIHCWLQKKLNLGPKLAATLYSLVLIALLIIPTVILSGALIEEARHVSKSIQNESLHIPPPPAEVADLPVVGEKLSDFWARASQNPKETFGQIEPQLKQFGKWLIHAAAGTGGSILKFVFSIIIAGVFLATAETGKHAARQIMKRATNEEQGPIMTDLAYATVKSVVNGILGIAVLQAILAGLGFVAMGIPAAGGLALLCLVLAVVQIDILLVLIPLSIYAFSSADVMPATLFLVWNIFVGLINNVLKPILLGRGVEAPMAVIFIGAIGGLFAHGIIGLFVGAVVFTLGYTLFMAWLGKKEGTDSPASKQDALPQE